MKFGTKIHDRDEEVKLIRSHAKTDLKIFRGKFLFLPMFSCKKVNVKFYLSNP